MSRLATTLFTSILALHAAICHAYHCVVIEDDIPSPFMDAHCVEKVQRLLSRHTAFSVEIAVANKPLLSRISGIVASNAHAGVFQSDGSNTRALRTFVGEGLKQTAKASITTALGYCLWNIADNLRTDKLFDLTEWTMDVLACGHSFHWKAAFLQSLAWGSMTGVTDGGFRAFNELNIAKWTYSPRRKAR